MAKVLQFRHALLQLCVEIGQARAIAELHDFTLAPGKVPQHPQIKHANLHG